MSSTQDRAGVALGARSQSGHAPHSLRRTRRLALLPGAGGRTPLDHAEHDCLTLLVGLRDGLPHAANGQPIAPSDGRVAQLLKDLTNGRKRSVRDVLAVVRCAAADGVPLAFIETFAQRMVAHARAAAAARPARSMGTLLRGEQRSNGVFDLDEFRMAAELAERGRIDDATLEAAVRDGYTQITATVAVIDWCEDELSCRRSLTALDAADIAGGVDAVAPVASEGRRLRLES